MKNIEDVLYAPKSPSPLEVLRAQFDMIQGPPLRSMITEADIQYLYNLIMDPKLNSNIPKKHKLISEFLRSKGFIKFGAGTNRLVFRYVNDSRILLKVAVDKVGLTDSLREYYNQEKLKPFVVKIFDVHPTGIVACVERVTPITSHKTFALLAEDYYTIMTKFFIGKYVMDDIGEKYFMNWGLRSEFGLVLLDYPYLYELDSNKLFCNARDRMNPMFMCGGEIDYDLGFNTLVCKKCGREYSAKYLAKAIKERGIVMIKNFDENGLQVKLMRGDEVLVDNTSIGTRFIEKNKKRYQSAPRVNKTFNLKDNPYSWGFNGLAGDNTPEKPIYEKKFKANPVPMNRHYKAEEHSEAPEPIVVKKTSVSEFAKPMVAPLAKKETLESFVDINKYMTDTDIAEIFKRNISTDSPFRQVKLDITDFLGTRMEINELQREKLLETLDSLAPIYDKAKEEVQAKIKAMHHHHEEEVKEEEIPQSPYMEEDGITFVKASDPVNLQQADEQKVKEEEWLKQVDQIEPLTHSEEIKEEENENPEEEEEMEEMTKEKHDQLVEEFFNERKRVIEDYLSYITENEPDTTYSKFRDDLHGMIDNDWPEYPFPDEMTCAEGHRWLDRYLRDNEFRTKYFYDDDEESLKVEKIHRNNKYSDMAGF